MRIMLVVAALIATGLSTSEAQPQRMIVHEVVVNAPPTEVWSLWTTAEGMRTLFRTPALKISVDLRPHGPYEVYFLPDNPPGMRGTEGAQIIAFQPERLLSFTWRNVPLWERIGSQYTHVTLTLKSEGDSATRVRLQQTGFGEGEDWDIAYSYFGNAWGGVLRSLAERYDSGQAAP